MAKNNLRQRPENQVWKFFTSVKLTVVILMLLASTSIIGTLIPQNASHRFYIQKYGEVFHNIFETLGLFDMYNAWWFLLLLGLLAMNIIVCSIDKLSSIWKVVFPDKVVFQLNRFQKIKNQHSFDVDYSVDVLREKYRLFMEKKIGSVTEQKTDEGVALFAEEGRWTRLGVYVVHLSILFLLVGAVIGGVWGFKGFVNINEGETVDVVENREKEGDIHLDFALRCNNFTVSFYDTGQPEEFKSSITIIENEKELFTRDIIVNVPLRFRGISFYQSSYGTASAQNIVLAMTSQGSGMIYSRKINFGETIDLPESGGRFTLDRFAKHYNFRGHNLGEGFVGRIIEGEQKEIEIFIPLKFPTFDKMRRGKFAFEVSDFEKKYYTGLQVTRDPGVWFVYTGFVFMIIGCWITFFMSHQSICVELRQKGEASSMVVVSGKANRNAQSMKIKTEKLAARMSKL